MTSETWMSKIRNVILDQRMASAAETISSLENMTAMEHYTCKSIIEDILHETSVREKNVKCIIGNDVYNDIEFFTSFSTKGSSTVFDTLSSCTLEGSKELLRMILKVPIHDVDVLKQRQNILQGIESIDVDVSKFNMLVQEKEKDVLWLFQEQDENLKDLYQMTSFRFCLFRPLNKYPTALSMYNMYKILASPVIGLVSPILYFLIPYMVIVYKLKIRVSFKTYIKIMIETMLHGDGGSGLLFGSSSSSFKYFKGISYALSIIFYFQGIFNSFEISKTVYKISKHIVQRINNAVQFLKDAMALIKTYWNDEISQAFFDTLGPLKTLQEEQSYVDTLHVIPFSLFSHFGKQLHTYLTIDKASVTSILLKTYVIQALMSCVNYKKERDIEYVQFEKHDTPRIHVKELFHPCIDKDTVVKNDICMQDKNIIITGPNAGGKSTFVKSLLIHSLISQCIGIGCSTTCTMTPFYNICSQINIPDSKGYESLFEAEMYRCKNKLDMLREIPSDKFSFFVMDEIFNSTNPVEGIAGAYAIAKKMSEYPSCLLVFTTHYIYLTKLKHTTKFDNYRMNVIKDTDITYPYKLEKGVSKQYIALDLLKKNGFDKDVIEEAFNIKDRLVKQT